ncbi:amidohydrolase [Burkholderia humptydooensis]|uniref:Amidohydrolase n=2 Tax=Burkholderia humptydooensis TaxID=430531 RepID=A0A7U4P535_9BURK|nr:MULTISPECIES: hypothetical protein [Burkholderia]AJY40767.1 peptidase family M20/M25/M40 [Burkholderia sp. 2002721687]ALX43136.1 peptidase M20 [Burkholderia humptydooensis]EIP84764.1 hypothetical protein A33K_18619 [Burkholderia humptydooensis MSMB43]QPS44950.1 amidohydrolase [Burkholderia humptydooensis]
MNMKDNTAAKETALNWVAEHLGDLSKWNKQIWDYAEPSWREYKSARFYVDLLREEGFTVEEASGGMPTAFCATWSNGPGPTVMTYAEYDGVPNNNQAATTSKTLRDESSEFSCGHTDPHSALGISTLGGLLAAKRAMEKHDIGGTLRYTGEPAEKMLGSKVVHGLRGYYDNVDALVSFHPFFMMPLCNTVRWDTHCGSYQSKVYTFVCDEPETWQMGNWDGSPISHASARAPGANAAMMTMYNTVKTMQDSMLPSYGGWFLGEALLPNNQATADNLAPFLAQIQYSWRCPDLEMADKIEAVLNRNAELAAEMAHCKLRTRWVTRTRPGRPNHTLAKLLYENFERVGPPKYDEKAIAVAHEIQRNLGIEPMEKPFLDETEKLTSPQETERRIREILAPWQLSWTSDDYVEMTHYTPTVRFYVARPTLAAPVGAKPYPAWVMNALGGIPETIDPTLDVASRTVALTLIDMLTRPEVLAEAKREFDERSKDYPGPLLPKDFEAPFDLPWPDYESKPDGTRVWHPTRQETE